MSTGYLDTPGGSVLCTLHEGRTGGGASGVLLCPPFGWDAMCAHRSLLRWAESLAGSGRPALRFDLPGTGDSAGGPGDPDRLEAWTAATAAAAAHLRAATGCARVTAIGIGLGGLLSLRALAAGAPLDDLVLWSVPARGRRLVRELRAFGALSGAATGDATDLPEGWIESGGYVLSAETLADLASVDVGALDLPPAAGRRVLLLEREGVAPDAALREALAATGADVETAPGPGYAAMLAEPQYARTPTAVFETVDAWLAREPATPATPEPTTPEPASPLRPTLAPAPGVRERPWSVQVPSGRLTGVLAEPDGPPGDRSLVLLNAGPQRRIGPNRMWVEAARRWAARGVPTIRIDLEGIGDSDGDEERYEDVAELYRSDFVESVGTVLDELERDGLPPSFVLAGLCSGAYWSLHAALADDRVRGAVMLNPRALTWDGGYGSAVRHAREYRAKLGDLETWRRIVRRDVSFAQAARVARRVLGGVLAMLTRRLRRAGGDETDAAGVDPAEAALEALGAVGRRGTLLFAGTEPLLADLEADGRLARLAARPHLTVERLDVDADVHTLRPIWLQRATHAALDRAVERADRA